MKVKDYMSTTVVTAYEQDGLRQTFYRMKERNIRHMPVLGERNQLVGIISDRDLRRPDWVDKEENVAHYYLLDNSKKVIEAMTTEPQTMRAECDIKKANDIFVKNGFGALPVVDDANNLVGILSAYDVLRAFGDILE